MVCIYPTIPIICVTLRPPLRRFLTGLELWTMARFVLCCYALLYLVVRCQLFKNLFLCLVPQDLWTISDLGNPRLDSRLRQHQARQQAGTSRFVVVSGFLSPTRYLLLLLLLLLLFCFVLFLVFLSAICRDIIKSR